MSRPSLYLVLAVLGALVPWVFFFHFFQVEGLAGDFVGALFANGAAGGFTAWKFRPGTHWSVSGMTVDRYVKGLEKMRAAVGPDFQLIQECNR
jgi:L-alanine-DL-glutamate epimerase-like enolase superfamily enzyme